MGNMTAMALPYMGVTIGGAALAPVTGGTSLAGATGIAALSNVGASMLAPVSVYAGQNCARPQIIPQTGLGCKKASADI